MRVWGRCFYVQPHRGGPRLFNIPVGPRARARGSVAVIVSADCKVVLHILKALTDVARKTDGGAPHAPATGQLVEFA